MSSELDGRALHPAPDVKILDSADLKVTSVPNHPGDVTDRESCGY